VLRLIVGLGNPGLKYEKTRHNAGFVFLEELASRYGCQWALETRFQGLLSQFKFQGNKVILLKPQTFMNLSGVSVSSVMNYYKLSADELLVVHDELDLPEGVLRFKKNGGHAGHNGLRDIMSHIATRDFCRLRVGIGRPAIGMEVAGYVLGSAASVARQAMVCEINRVCDHLEIVLQGDVERLNGILADSVKNISLDKK
jgi:PTH1 family peptidyl-tRNA hydrolase